MTELIYVGDPMCSWCYAFEPELDQILARTERPMRMVMGGLFVGSRALPLDDRLRTYLDETWTRVADLSGQPVDHGALDREGWVYDTEPACRAVVVARAMDPTRAQPLFRRIQRAFYAEGIDVVTIEALAGLAAEAGLEPLEFADRMGSDEAIDVTAADFDQARALGAHGFPMLLADTGDERIVVSAGYNKAAPVLRAIEVLAS